MTIIPIGLGLLSVGMILLMIACGVGFFTKQELLLNMTSHVNAGGADIVGARFIFLAGLGVAVLCCFYYLIHTSGAS